MNKQEVLSLAAEFVSDFEGFSAQPYYCAGGKLTFGFGSRTEFHPTAKFPMSQKEAKEFLMADLKLVLESIATIITVSLTLNQTVALVSLVYNIGSGNFVMSTLRKLLNESKYKQAAEEFLKWTKSNKKTLPGLVRRRFVERQLFLTEKDATLEDIQTIIGASYVKSS